VDADAATRFTNRPSYAPVREGQRLRVTTSRCGTRRGRRSRDVRRAVADAGHVPLDDRRRRRLPALAAAAGGRRVAVGAAVVAAG
jgi:hypothetical protein